MHGLTEEQYQIEAEPILRQIFVNDNAFDQPFATSVVGRRIVYPCEDCVEPPLIDAIIAAAANLGDTGCYISLIQRSKTFNEPNHCYIALSEFLEVYAGSDENKLIGPRLGMNPYGLNSVIYSASGKWGLMKSDERHGLLGGPPKFLEDIRAVVPDLDRQVYGFFERLRSLLVAIGINPPDITRNKWLPGLLEHVYGQEASEKMLQEARRSYN